MSDERDKWELVKQLATAFSTQAQVANRTWLGLMTVALFAVLPRVPGKDGNAPLPFNLQVSAIWLQTAVFAMLVVLAVAFAAAHAQQVRALRLAHDIIDSLTTDLGPEEVRPRDLFDISLVPSLNRVAPLAQFLRDTYQFLAGSKSYPMALRLATVGYYAFLKFASLIVYFVLPFWALWKAYGSVSVSGRLWVILVTGGFVLAAVVLFQVLVSDVVDAWRRVLPRLWRSPETAHLREAEADAPRP